MRNWWFWSFERGSFQYDIICGLIVAFIALMPSAFFNDRPDFMRLPPANEPIRAAHDDAGNAIYTIRLDGLPQTADEKTLVLAVADRLMNVVQQPFKVSRAQPIYNTRGALVAYSIWITKSGGDR